MPGTLFGRFWFGFKLLLSLVLVGSPLALFILAPAARWDPMFLGLSAGMLLLAVLPWVHWDPPSRAVGLIGIALSLCLGAIAWSHAAGQTTFPQNCILSRQRLNLLCTFENLLHKMGGDLLAALPFALGSALLLWGSLRLTARTSRRARPPFVLDDDI